MLLVKESARGTPHLSGPHHFYVTASLKSKSSSSSLSIELRPANILIYPCLSTSLPSASFPLYLAPKIPSFGISCIWLSFTKASILRYKSTFTNQLYLAVLHQSFYPQVRERVQCAQLSPSPPAPRDRLRRQRRPPVKCLGVASQSSCLFEPLSNHIHFGGLVR